MPTITLEEAQARLSELIACLQPGEELVITRDEQPVARLVGELKPTKQQSRRLGTMQGSVLYMAPDFDLPLEEFKEYLE